MSTAATPTWAFSQAAGLSHHHKYPKWRRRSISFSPRRGLPPRSPNLLVAENALFSGRFSPNASRMEIEDEEEKWWDGGSDSSSSCLEEELFDFMVNSSNPRSFPSKRDLVAAGRMDLVQAIEKQGGWFSLGWDSEASGSSREIEMQQCDHRDVTFSDASSSGRESRDGDDMSDGIEGILSRLEKERSLKFGFVYARRGLGGWRDKACDRDDSNSLASTGEKFGQFMLLDPGDDFHAHEVAEEIPYGGNVSKDLSQKHISTNEKIKNVAIGSSRNYQRLTISDSKDQSLIQLRLQSLECKLKSTLSILRSKSVPVLPEYQASSSIHSSELCDSLEFQETKVIKATDQLRVLRANLLVLEGKMALDISEAQSLLSEKQKKINAAKKALDTLRVICIVWPNTASDVLLCGSFDGWTSQRKMEQSRTGEFSLNLRLYPGRYEIKFIVDGCWRIDPLRPIVNNNGHENNLILVT